MKKFLKTGLMGLVITMFFVIPTFAATNSATFQPNKGDTIITKGDGYTVVVPKAVLKTSTTNGEEIQPMSLTSYSIGQGGSGTFYGGTEQNYANGKLIDSSTIALTDQHNWTGSDYLWSYGAMSANYTGTNPWNADSFTMAPSQTVTASATIIGVSVPGGITFTPSYCQATLNWLSSTINNNYKATYNWSQWETSTSGRFTCLSANDQVVWRFGTANYAQLNTVRVNIN